MLGVYINCSKYPFIDWILDGRKQYETRSRDMLRDLAGKRVYLIETGTHGKPVVRASAILRPGRKVDRSSLALRQAAMIDGSTYDIPANSTKVFYRLADVRPVSPFHLPEIRINHGRSYTEWR